MSRSDLVPMPEVPWDGVVDRQPTAVAQSGPLALLVRALVAAAILVAWCGALATPVPRDLPDLYADLDAGRVATVTLERPRGSWDEGYGTFRVEWTGSSRPAFSSYTVSVVADPGEPDVDQAELIESLAEQSPRPVEVVRRVGPLPSASSPSWLVVVAVGGLGGAFLLLVAGPRPRLATRWAWFWLGTLPFAWFAFVVLEPVPSWRRGPAPRMGGRLRGGAAFVLGLVVPALLGSLPWVGPWLAPVR